MEDFIHLHVHTHYSILDGQSKVANLVKKAVGDGMRGMAITDHGVMYGVKELADCCAKVNKERKAEGLEPFKPIFGCEMYVARRTKEDKDKAMGDNSGYHLVVLAKNYKGYKNLIKLVSRAWVDGYYYKPRTDRVDLERYHEGLIVCSACIAGEVPRKILDGDLEGAREAAQWYHDLFGDDSVHLVHIAGHTEGMFAALIRNGERYVLLNADGAASPRSWAEGTVPGICENSVRAKKALDWIGSMSRDPACVASLCSHDPDIAPQTIEF